MDLTLKQLDYNKKQNKINQNILDILEINNISIVYNFIEKKQLKYLDYNSINFLNHYLILRNLNILHPDLYYKDVKFILDSITFNEFKSIDDYYILLKTLKIKDVLLIDKKFYNYFDDKIKFLNHMVKNNITLNKNQLEILNNYIDSLSIKEGV